MISFGLGFVLLACGFCLRLYLQNRRLQSALDSEYRRTLSELAVAARSLEESLTLLRYAPSSSQTALHAAQVSRQSADTAYLLGRLPVSGSESEDVVAAFARIGGWADALSRQSNAPDSPPQKDHVQILPRFSRAVQVCTEVLDEWERAALAGEVFSLFGQNSPANGEQDGTTAQGFRKMLAELEKLPLSEVLDETAEASKEPLMLRGLAEISEGEALRAALDFTGLEEGQLRYLRRTEGRIPCYGIGGHLDGGEISVEITRQGGAVLSMMSSRKAETKALSLEQARHNAEEFLKSRGYEGMVFCEAADREDILLLQYVYSQDGVLCYPDTIQIGMAADTGKVVSFESEGYLMHHRPRREIAPPVLSEEEAISDISSDLEAETLSLCIRRSGGEQEQLYYRAVCRAGDGRRLVFYIHADSGETESTIISNI